jgi:PAS domain S-box-containing protein
MMLAMAAPGHESESKQWLGIIDSVPSLIHTSRPDISTGEPFLHEARVRRADGEYRWMLHHKVTLRDERGEVVKWYGSSIDIEDRKRAEERLRESA